MAGARPTAVVRRTSLLVLNRALITVRRYRVRMCTRDIGINFNERSVRRTAPAQVIGSLKTVEAEQETVEPRLSIFFYKCYLIFDKYYVLFFDYCVYEHFSSYNNILTDT